MKGFLVFTLKASGLEPRLDDRKAIQFVKSAVDFAFRT